MITGAARMQENNDGDKNEIYNAIEVVQRDRIIAAFDKNTSFLSANIYRSKNFSSRWASTIWHRVFGMQALGDAF